MEKQGQTRPRVTIFAPPQSQQISRPRCRAGELHTALGLGNPHTTVGLGSPHTAVGLGNPHIAVGLGNPHTAVGLGNPHSAVELGAPHPLGAGLWASDTKPFLTLSSPADWDLDLDYPLPTPSGAISAHKLQLLVEKVRSPLSWDKAHGSLWHKKAFRSSACWIRRGCQGSLQCLGEAVVGFGPPLTRVIVPPS